MNDELTNLREENDAMINEMVMLRAKVNRLESENKSLRFEQRQAMNDEIELTVTQPATELQLTKDSSVQGVPLSNEAYEKAIKEDE